MIRGLVKLSKYSHYRTMTTMDAFLQRQQQAERTIKLLKEELTALARVAENQQKIREQNEIEKIKAENKLLESSIQNLRAELQYFETQNGVKQVMVPRVKPPVAATTKTQPAEEQPAKPEKQQNATAKQEQPAKPKKEKKEKEGKNKNKPAADAAKPVDISRICIKVGKIVNCINHPDADGLLVETVDFNEEKPRTICSGIPRFYKPEQLINRLAPFICNLKPVKMRGISSEGMIMCASTPDKVEVLEVPAGAEAGDRIICPDFPGEADDLLNPKKKVWEKVQPDLLVNADSVATYKGSPFTIEGKGICVAPSMRECPIK